MEEEEEEEDTCLCGIFANLEDNLLIFAFADPVMTVDVIICKRF